MLRRGSENEAPRSPPHSLLPFFLSGWSLLWVGDVGAAPDSQNGSCRFHRSHSQAGVHLTRSHAPGATPLACAAVAEVYLCESTCLFGNYLGWAGAVLVAASPVVVFSSFGGVPTPAARRQLDLASNRMRVTSRGLGFISFHAPRTRVLATIWGFSRLGLLCGSEPSL